MRRVSFCLLLFAGAVLAQEPPSANGSKAEESPAVIEVITGQELDELAKNRPPIRKPVPEEKITADEAVDMPQDI